jgi:predicted small secreted protein
MKSSVKTMMLLGATLLMLAACNTTQGVGKDISGAGNAITRGATR